MVQLHPPLPFMHTLAELRTLLKQYGREILDSPGMYIQTDQELWTMKFDEYYIDGVFIKRKDILSLLKATQRKKKDERKSSKVGDSRRSSGRSGKRDRKVSNTQKPRGRRITANKRR